MINIGLTELQAQTYLWLLEHGSTTPPRLVKELKLTRTNAYKVLDSLVDLGLASKSEVQKKLTYFAEDPIALSSLAAEERNKAIALEQNTKEAVFELRRKFNKTNGGTDIKTHKGKTAVKAAYEHQAKLQEPIHFIQSRIDRVAMGFETMDYIRRLPAKFGTRRFGITPDDPLAPINPEVDARSSLTRTWISDQDYTAPVEWTVAGDELMIINFDDNASAIRIKNAVVAEGFKQLWQALDKNLRANPEYKKLPRKAARKI